MTRLDVDRPLTRTRDISLRSPPNWTAVGFFAGLGALHLYLATSAFVNARVEGMLSLIFGVFFLGASVACWLLAKEIALLTDRRQLRLRFGVGRLRAERLVGFDQVRSVRLTLLHPTRPTAATIELVCDREVIECPPTAVPREEALCLAITMGVRLVKVYGEGFGPVAERLDRLPGGE